MASILSAHDFSQADVDHILARADELSRECDRVPTRASIVIGLIFLEPSLRTRVGFTAAAFRLGWQQIDVFDLRHSPNSMMESWQDTLRVVSGYCDAIVARPLRPLLPADVALSLCPVINGGDTGEAAEHPSQALVDIFAIERLVGPTAQVRLAVVGDPRMRAVRSLLAVLAQRPPARLRFIADPAHLQDLDVASKLEPLVDLRTTWDELDDIDVVYVAGIPHEALPLDRREALLATAERVALLPKKSILLSPMPVIDEMDRRVRRSDRNRMFTQNDLGVYARMALLEHVLGDSDCR